MRVRVYWELNDTVLQRVEFRVARSVIFQEGHLDLDFISTRRVVGIRYNLRTISGFAATLIFRRNTIFG